MGASESKLAFKQSIFQLSTPTEIHPEDQLWAQFYTLPESADDVFSLWSPNDLHNLTATQGPRDVQTQPSKNLETLLYTLVARLVKLQTESGERENVNVNVEIVNCMRILTRLFPFIYEATHLREWTTQFFWETRRPTYFWDKKRERPGRLFDGLDPSKEFGIEELETNIGPPLGEVLLDCVVKYCFFPGFTIPHQIGEDGRVQDREVSVRVWQTGIGSSKSLGCSRENERFQQETVRLLLTICSAAMYMTPNDISTTQIHPLNHLTTSLEKRTTNGLLCSLLNTVLKYNPNLWSDVTTATLDLATGTPDLKKLLVTNSLHLILVLVIYSPPSETKNQFRQSLCSLHRPDDLQFIQTGISTVLSQPVSGNFAVMVGKDKSLPWAPEIISLLWELLQCNKRFRRYLIETSCALDYIVLILYYALEALDQAAKHGILRMCVFVLQTLSAEAAFAEKLNLPMKHTETLPSILRIANFHGTYADFLICSISKIFKVVGRRAELESLYPALVAILGNVLPGQRNLGRGSGGKVVEIFKILADPRFLMANDGNHLLLVGLLEGICAVDVEANPRFKEVLVANKGRFKALREISVEGAMAEIERNAQAMKDQGTASTSRTPSIDVPTRSEDDRFAIGDEDDEEDDIGDTTRPTAGEKARGKRPEVVPVSSRSSLQIETGGWRPTQAWLESWYSRLPLETLFRAMDGKGKGRVVDPPAPVPFIWTPLAIGWYTALLWSRIYLQEAEVFQGSGGLYAGTNVVLFRRERGGREISLRSPRGAIDAVGMSIVGRISSLTLKGGEGSGSGTGPGAGAGS